MCVCVNNKYIYIRVCVCFCNYLIIIKELKSKPNINKLLIKIKVLKKLRHLIAVCIPNSAERLSVN